MKVKVYLVSELWLDLYFLFPPLFFFVDLREIYFALTSPPCSTESVGFIRSHYPTKSIGRVSPLFTEVEALPRVQPAFQLQPPFEVGLSGSHSRGWEQHLIVSLFTLWETVSICSHRSCPESRSSVFLSRRSFAFSQTHPLEQWSAHPQCLDRVLCYFSFYVGTGLLLCLSAKIELPLSRFELGDF